MPIYSYKSSFSAGSVKIGEIGIQTSTYYKSAHKAVHDCITTFAKENKKKNGWEVTAEIIKGKAILVFFQQKRKMFSAEKLVITYEIENNELVSLKVQDFFFS